MNSQDEHLAYPFNHRDDHVGARDRVALTRASFSWHFGWNDAQGKPCAQDAAGAHPYYDLWLDRPSGERNFIGSFSAWSKLLAASVGGGGF